METRSTGNMAAVIGRDETLKSGRQEFQETRTLAIPPGLTFAEVEAWVKPWLGTGERMNGIQEYR